MNLFFTSSIILFFTSFLMGLLVYLKDRKNNLNRSWFVFSVFVASWSILLYFVTSAKTEAGALSWQYLLDIFALGIPVAYFYFIANFLNLKISRAFSWAIFGITLNLAYFSTTTFFKIGVVKKFTFFWVETGPYYFIFPVFFLSLILYALWLLVSAYYQNKNNINRREQIKYQIIAGIVGFVGGVVNFLPQLFNVFPFGSHVILVYISLVSYLILKYRLFNVKLILVEIALILVNFFLFVNIFLSKVTGILWINILLFVSILFFSIFLIRGIYKDIRDTERIEGLVKDMATANKHLFALEQQKTEFVSIASHQLRTPMTVIKGYASMVLEGAFGKLPDEAKEAMTKLYKSSDKIVSLIEDLLTVSRIEQGRGMPIFETINFVSFMQELLVPVAAEMRDAGLKFSFDITKGSESSRVPLDKKKFEQALRHIIGNAIKYTKAPGSVNLTISNDTTQHRVYLSISDTGVGMSEEQVKALMEKSDVENSARKGFMDTKENEGDTTASINPSQKASGIGFYIAQEIINAHYGSVRVESDGPDQGTTVIIELPEFEERRKNPR